MKIIFIIFSFIFSFGCATSDIENVYHSRGSKFVTIKYLNNGADFIIKQRRHDAILKAKENCGGGKVELLDESNKTRSTGAYAQNINNYTFVNETTSDYKFLIFKCVEDSEPEVY